MSTPTERAMRAARAALEDVAAREQAGYSSAKQAIHETALAIDTATGLPALLAKRDALRAALEACLPLLPSDYDASVVYHAGRAALALGEEGQS